MSTYLIDHIRIPGDVPGSDLLTYLEEVEATLEAHGGRFLANGEPTVVEGAWPGLAVILEFPDRAAVEAWASSPAYGEIRPLRIGSAVSDVVLVDGLPPGQTVRAAAQQIRAAIGA